jgi:hypothetical protein
MSPLPSLITFVLMSLTVSATPSPLENALLMSEQIMEATAKNQIKFGKVEQSVRMDEIVSNFSVSNAIATQEIASSYYIIGVYSDASCSTTTTADIIPLGVCLSVANSIYSYSIADKKVTINNYGNSKCTGTTTSSPSVIDIADTCDGLGTTGQYLKRSIIPSISSLNTAGFLVM